MSYPKPVARVVSLLQNNGYKILRDLRIGTISFEFTEVLVGTRYSFDLVVVADMIVDPNESRLRKKVGALARALDLVESRRSLTLVVVGPSPSDITIRELSRSCRVLAVGTPTGDEAEASIRDVLAVLLPLNLPKVAIGAVHPLDRLRAEVASPRDSIALSLMEAAEAGSSDVERVLGEWFEEVIAEESR